MSVLYQCMCMSVCMAEGFHLDVVSQSVINDSALGLLNDVMTELSAKQCYKHANQICTHSPWHNLCVCVCVPEKHLWWEQTSPLSLSHNAAINSPVNKAVFILSVVASFRQNAHLNTPHLHKYPQSRFTVQQKWINAESCHILGFIWQ